MKYPVFAILICLTARLAFSDDDLNVLADQPGKQLELLLNRQFNEQLDRRLAAYNAIGSRADCAKWQRERRDFFLRQIGGLPERTPLNAKTVGELKGKGYRVEKILFESRPGHHVTANLYLPETTGPYPGVLIPCGHSHTGKAAGGYQRMSILLARNGMAALCYDPIGQGERYQSLDFQHDHETFDSVSYRLETPHRRVQFLPTVEHTLMGVGSIQLGTNTAQYRIWDGMRAIDYLQSRDDILADKIGCAGNSGGGTLTAYLMALDARRATRLPHGHPHRRGWRETLAIGIRRHRPRPYPHLPEKEKEKLRQAGGLIEVRPICLPRDEWLYRARNGTPLTHLGWPVAVKLDSVIHVFPPRVFTHSRGINPLSDLRLCAVARSTDHGKTFHPVPWLKNSCLDDLGICTGRVDEEMIAKAPWLKEGGVMDGSGPVERLTNMRGGSGGAAAAVIDGKIVVACARGVYRSDDNGKTWQLLKKAGMPDQTPTFPRWGQGPDLLVHPEKGLVSLGATPDGKLLLRTSQDHGST